MASLNDADLEFTGARGGSSSSSSSVLHGVSLGTAARLAWSTGRVLLGHSAQQNICDGELPRELLPCAGRLDGRGLIKRETTDSNTKVLGGRHKLAQTQRNYGLHTRPNTITKGAQRTLLSQIYTDTTAGSPPPSTHVHNLAMRGTDYNVSKRPARPPQAAPSTRQCCTAPCRPSLSLGHSHNPSA